MNLQELRKKLDGVNLKALDLLNKRATLLQEVVKYKDKIGMEEFDSAREMEMMKLVIDNNNGPLFDELVKDIYNSIFSASLEFMGIDRRRNLLD